jgi:hypothetical protein
MSTEFAHREPEQSASRRLVLFGSALVAALGIGVLLGVVFADERPARSPSVVTGEMNHDSTDHS